MGDLLDTIRPALESLVAPPRWRVAFSGGVDSTVLLHLLCRYRNGAAGAPLSAIHIDHGLSPYAGAWADHCADLCRDWDVPLQVCVATVSPGREGLEAAARAARWQAFATTAELGEVLFVAHHLDDQIETVLLRLLRGSSVRGLAAMAGRRHRDGYTVCRPLLVSRREEILAYAKAQGLVWVDDESNANERLSRNWLRRRVVPALVAHWPDYRERIGATAAHCADDAVLLDEIADADLAGATGVNRWGPWLDLEFLAGRSRQRIRNALARWLTGTGAPTPTPGQWRALFTDLLDAAADRLPRLELAPMTLRRYRHRLYLVGVLVEPAPPRFEIAPGETLALAGGGTLHWQDASSYNETIEVRFRHGGEHFRHSETAALRPLKKLLAELGVPPWLRDHVPLLYAGGELVAIADLLLSNAGAEIFPAPQALVWTPPGTAGSD